MKVLLGSYDPAKVIVTVAVRDITGFGTDELVRVERADENEATTKVGAQGEYTFVINQDKSGVFILTLKQLSPSHIFLQSLKESLAVFPVAIRVRHSFLELATASQCMIGVAPRKLYGKDEAEYEWQLAAGELIETDKAI